jgi:lactate permease
MVALWSVGLVVLAIRSRHPRREVGHALARWRRPALVIVAFMLLARVLVGAGVPQTLASALQDGLGGLAPFAAPLLAGASGFFTGTNVGSNSAMMPLQTALGTLSGLAPSLLPSVQNFVGSACMVLSPSLVSIAASLDRERPSAGAVWRLGWPVFPIAIGIGLVALALG